MIGDRRREAKVFQHKKCLRAFLVVQWLRVHQSVQGTLVLSLVQGDPMCHEATKPVLHNHWTHVLQCDLELELCDIRSHQDGKPTHHNWRVASALCN